MRKVGVSQEEKNLSYYKYFEKEMAAIPPEKLEKLVTGPSDKMIVPFEEKDRFLTGEDSDYCQVGYGVCPDGTAFVCNTTYMPNVKPEMLDWWFAWHSVGSDLRYKIWDPEDHYFARADKADYVCDPNVPMNQKTWGVTHYILEDVGPGPEMIQLKWLSPANFGFNPANVGTDHCSSMVCAAGLSSFAASMVHMWYPYADGVMLCSRFWLGYGYTDGTIKKLIPDDERTPDIIPKALYAHAIKEFSNLAEILPTLYEEEKDIF